MILASKIIGRSEMEWFRNPRQPGKLNRAQFNEAIDASLKRLQTDYIDLYQLHWPERNMPWGSNPTRFKPSDFAVKDDETSIAEQLEILGDLVKAGKIRHVGLSNESPGARCASSPKASGSAAARRQRAECLSPAEPHLRGGHGGNLAARRCRLSGLFAAGAGLSHGKYLDGARPPARARRCSTGARRYEKPGSNEAIRDYLGVAKQFGLDPAQMALAFVTSRPFMTSNIIGATTMEQLRTDIAS